jgi:hypothetical protein
MCKPISKMIYNSTGYEKKLSKSINFCKALGTALKTADMQPGE